MQDVVENIKALKNRTDWALERIRVHTCAQNKRNLRYAKQIEKLDNCMRSNAYDIANIINKVDDLEEEIHKLSKYTKDFVQECRKVIQDLDRDIRELL